MKVLKLSVVSTALAVLLGIAPSAIGSAPQRVGQYDFSYLTSGELRATPVQVFDDGKSTYFQFRAGEPVPAIFNNQDGAVGLLVPVFEGPYIKVSQVGGRFTLQLGRSQAQVVYGGTGRENTPQITALESSGLMTPYKGIPPAGSNTKLLASIGPTLAIVNSDALESNSYATPAKGDRVQWKDSEVEATERQVWFVKGSYVIGKNAQKAVATIAEEARTANTVTVIGRDDETMKEGLDKARANALRDALVKAGIPASKVIVKTGVQVPSKDKLWASDIRIERVLPTQIARPTPAQPAGAAERTMYVKSNLENLVASGALTRDQAQAILQRNGDRQSSPPVAAHSEVPSAGFDFKTADQNVSVAIKRWAAATGYQVVWEAPLGADAPVTGDGALQAKSMRDALEKLMSGLQKRGYDIGAVVYSNRVIRFTGGTK